MENFLTQVMTSHGYLALIIFAFVEACCIPISSEITFAFAGVIAATHPDKFTVAAVIIIGTLAEMGGSLTSYAVGRRGGRHLLDRYGKWVLISRSDLDRAEGFFAGRGSWAVAVARALPIVRCFASFGAGVVEVPVLPFTLFSLAGTLAWTTGLTLLGYNLGTEVHKFFKSFSVVGVILVVLLLAALIAHRVHAIRKDGLHHAATQPLPADPARPVVPADRNGIGAGPGAGPASSNGTGPGTRTGRVGGAHRSGRGGPAS